MTAPWRPGIQFTRDPIRSPGHHARGRPPPRPWRGGWGAELRPAACPEASSVWSATPARLHLAWAPPAPRTPRGTPRPALAPEAASWTRPLTRSSDHLGSSAPRPALPGRRPLPAWELPGSGGRRWSPRRRGQERRVLTLVSCGSRTGKVSPSNFSLFPV